MLDRVRAWRDRFHGAIRPYIPAIFLVAILIGSYRSYRGHEGVYPLPVYFLLLVFWVIFLGLPWWSSRRQKREP